MRTFRLWASALVLAVGLWLVVSGEAWVRLARLVRGRL